VGNFHSTPASVGGWAVDTQSCFSFLLTGTYAWHWQRGGRNHMSNCCQSWHLAKLHMTDVTGLTPQLQRSSSGIPWFLRMAPSTKQHLFLIMQHSQWGCVSHSAKLYLPSEVATHWARDRNMQGFLITNAVQIQTMGPLSSGSWLKHSVVMKLSNF
jgi:hypothetical protein